MTTGWFFSTIFVLSPAIIIIWYIMMNYINKVKNQAKFIIDKDNFYIYHKWEKKCDCKVQDISRFHLLEYTKNDFIILWIETTKFTLEIYNKNNQKIIELHNDDFFVWKSKDAYAILKDQNKDILFLKGNLWKDSEKNIFVYGTLMYPEILKVLTWKKFKMKDAILPWYKRYGVLEWDKYKAYPAITYSPKDRVQGKLLTNISFKNQSIFDFFEGPEYWVQKVGVIVWENIIFAKVYIRKDDIHTLWGDWNIQEFENKYLNIYVKEKIPLIMKDYKF